MIISASYKTDIPTFYARWFINRLEAGYCKTVNSRSAVVSQVPLTKPFVDGFVFGTKNIAPFALALTKVAELGFPFVVQHTINGYPTALEHSVVDSQRACDSLRRVSVEFGSRTCVWRYDTILMTSLTDEQFHFRNFSGIAARLAGVTDEVVISFAQVYR
ncbi:MAG: DUF1848 family protein, partial [Pyrinomonadaceae bacterium]